MGRNRTYTLTIFRDFQISKIRARLAEADCRDLTSLCLRLCIGVKLRAASFPSIAYCVTRAPPLKYPPYVRYKLLPSRLGCRYAPDSRVAVLRARTAYFKAVRLYKMRVYERCARALK